LSDGRRMSFKGLNDSNKRKALAPILEAADQLDGLSFSIAVSKDCESLFTSSPPMDLSNPQFESFRQWKPKILEKAFLVVHILGLLLGGLAAPGQNALWFTDDDDIAANDTRLRDLTNLFGWVSTEYLSFSLGHLRCGTTRCDNGTLQIEDFAAIPDLIAGALSEQLTMKSRKPELLPGFLISSPIYSAKTTSITWWYSKASARLKRLFCVVDPSGDGKHIVSFFHFHNQF